MFCKARPVPYALKEKVETELKRLEDEGIISKVERSEWASPIVPVPKPNGGLRLCCDYKVSINKFLDDTQYSLPNAEDLFATLEGGKIFTKIYLTQAYLQLELDAESKRFLTINTHRGLFQFNRLPFGVSSAPGIFQGVMDQILQGIEGVVCYLDDILISAPSEQRHSEILNEVLKRLERYNVRVKGQKCEWHKPSVEYLGHIVDAEGIHPTAEKLVAIKQAPSPTNITELRSFLGLLNYYGKFIP